MSSINDHGHLTKPQLLPIFSLLLAATLWGVFWYPLRLLEQQGLHGLWATLFIYAGTAFAMIYMLRGRYSEFRVSPVLLLGIGLASGWTNVSFILAVLDGNIVRVLLLFYLSPLWATLLGWLLLGEQLQRRSVLVLMIAMSGALVMLWPESLASVLPQQTADWLALSSGLSFAITNALVRSASATSIEIKTVSSWLGAIAFSVILIFITGVPLAPASGTAILAAFLIGTLLMVLMTASVVYGVTHMPIHRSAIILLFEIVAGAVSSQLLTEEVLSWREWLGGSLVITAALVAANTQLQVDETKINVKSQ